MVDPAIARVDSEWASDLEHQFSLKSSVATPMVAGTRRGGTRDVVADWTAAACGGPTADPVGAAPSQTSPALLSLTYRSSLRSDSRFRLVHIISIS